MIWKKDPAAYLQINSFIFPYDKVKQGSVIILYGMGKVGAVFYRQLCQTRYCSIVAWADRNPRHIADISVTVPIIIPDEIKDYCFDYVVIAIEKRFVACRISEKLLFCGIHKEKIIIPNL